MLSEREELILKVIGKKKMTLQEISDEVFADERKPFDDVQTIRNSIERIISKCAHHKVDWTLTKDRLNNKLLISKEKLC